MVTRPRPASAAMSPMLASGSRARHVSAASSIRATFRRASARSCGDSSADTVMVFISNVNVRVTGLDSNDKAHLSYTTVRVTVNSNMVVRIMALQIRGHWVADPRRKDRDDTQHRWWPGAAPLPSALSRDDHGHGGRHGR